MALRCKSAGAVVTLALLVVACGDDDGDDATAPALADLSGRTFTSTSVEGWTIVDGSVVTITFDGDGVSASAGCNTLRGDAAITDGALVVAEPMASTMMACSDELMAQDEWLQGFLTASPRVGLDTAELTLTTDGATLVASSCQRAAAPVRTRAASRRRGCPAGAQREQRNNCPDSQDDDRCVPRGGPSADVPSCP